MGQERLGPSYFFISLVLGPLNSLLWYVPSSRYMWSLAPYHAVLQDTPPAISTCTLRKGHFIAGQNCCKPVAHNTLLTLSALSSSTRACLSHPNDERGHLSHWSQTPRAIMMMMLFIGTYTHSDCQEFRQPCSTTTCGSQAHISS